MILPSHRTVDFTSPTNSSRGLQFFDPDTLEWIEMLGEGHLPGVHDTSLGPNSSLIVADQDVEKVLLMESHGEKGGTLLSVTGDGAPWIRPNEFGGSEGAAVDGSRYFSATQTITVSYDIQLL